MDFGKPHQNERIPVKPLLGCHRTSAAIADNTNEIGVTSLDILPLTMTSEGFGLCRGLAENFRSGEVALFHSSNISQ
jgi:hypothetical protein